MNLLIVDDDPGIRDALVLLFEDDNFTIHTARNGEEALHYLCSHPVPHVVLLDNVMPHLNGSALMRVIRSDSDLAKRVEIILMTASAQRISKPAHDLLEDLDAECIAKPFDLDKVYTAVFSAAGKLKAA